MRAGRLCSRVHPACLACHPSHWKILDCSNKLLIGHGGSLPLISYGNTEIHTHTHIHAQLSIHNALITRRNTHQKLTCRCFPCISVPLLHSESSWEIKLLLVDPFFPLLLLLMFFPVYKDEFSHFFVCSGVLAIADPCRWVSQNNHFHTGEGSSQRSGGAAASFEAANTEKIN